MRNTQWQNKIIVPKDIDISDLSDETVYKLSIFFKKELTDLKERGVFKELEYYQRTITDEIIEQFSFLAFIAMLDYDEHKEYGFEEEELYKHFNFNLNQLYNICGVNKLIWIEM